MGKNEAASPSKSDKSSSPVREQPTIHPYPDWAAMQAYYGPGVAMTPQYFGTAVASGHAPHAYMWRPQPLMTPFGTPYAAIYPPGVYSHPSVPLGSHTHCQGIASSSTISEAVMAIPLSVETPAKSSSNKDRGLVKKLKGLDGLAVSATISHTDNAVGATDGLSQSGESGGEGSSDGSDGNNELKGCKMQRKSSEDTPSSGKDGKAGMLANAIHGGEANATSNVSLGVAVPPASTTEKRDEREMKRERRKQSNRESARRSRLRKQAETEELALKVETLSTENTILKSEISRLLKNSKKLRQENSALTEKLQNAQLRQVEEMPPAEGLEPEGITSLGTENFLSKINDSSSNKSSDAQRTTKSKLHQLLDMNPRADTVAAG